MQTDAAQTLQLKFELPLEIYVLTFFNIYAESMRVSKSSFDTTDVFIYRDAQVLCCLNS